MKSQALTVMCFLAISPAVTPAAGAGEEISEGDSADNVREVLGDPPSYMKRGNYQIWVYNRGRIEFENDKVTEVSLVSAEEAQRLLEQRRERERARTAVLAEQRERLRAEGERLKTEALADARFEEMPGTDRLAFWQEFQRRFPEVSVELPLAKAAAKAKQEKAEADELRRLARMEQRIAEAERKAAEAANDDSNRYTRYRRYNPPFVDYYPILGRAPCRPKKARDDVHVRKPTPMPSGPRAVSAGDYTDRKINHLRSYPKSPRPSTRTPRSSLGLGVP